jgi:hypothetical protein
MDLGDPADVLMEAVFAATWDGLVPEISPLRIRGTMKGYL